MTLYSYTGPVMVFDKVVSNRWHGETYAVSEAKARCNLAYQFTKELGRVPRTKVSLPGKITTKEMNNG